MKRLVLVFLLVAQGAIGAFGQYLVSPIKKVIPNHNYTVGELKDFINSDDPIVEPWCKTFLGLAQNGLLRCGEDLFIVRGHDNPRQTVLYLIDNYCIETVRDLDPGFENSGKTLENTIKFVIDKRGFKNMNFLTFKFGSCEKDIVKMNCFNTPNLLERKIYVPKPKEPEPKPKTEPVVEHRWQDYPYHQDNNKVIIITDEESGFYKWQRRNGWWAYPLGSAVVVTGVGFIAHDNQHKWYFWFDKPKKFVEPIIEPRTMPDGIPAVPTPSTPGVPSDPRGMPSGTGYVHTNFGGGITVFRF